MEKINKNKVQEKQIKRVKDKKIKLWIDVDDEFDWRKCHMLFSFFIFYSPKVSISFNGLFFTLQALPISRFSLQNEV